jgi:hypothetical protein
VTYCAIVSVKLLPCIVAALLALAAPTRSLACRGLFGRRLPRFCVACDFNWPTLRDPFDSLLRDSPDSPILQHQGQTVLWTLHRGLHSKHQEGSARFLIRLSVDALQKFLKPLP